MQNIKEKTLLLIISQKLNNTIMARTNEQNKCDSQKNNSRGLNEEGFNLWPAVARGSSSRLSVTQIHLESQ